VRKYNGGTLTPWRKGQSGNPRGIQGEQYLEAVRICREATPEAARRMVELMRSKDERVALMASDKVWERAFGKPREAETDADDPATQERRAQLIAAMVALLSGQTPKV
jgi:hypothetical protein